MFFFFFFFSFFYQLYPWLRNCKLVFLILKISQYDGSRRWVQPFPRYPCKNWYLHFYKAYHHQIWQAGTSTRFDSNETNEAGAYDVITSIITWKTKNSISTTRVPMATKVGRMVTYLAEFFPIKSHDPLIIWFCKIMRQTKIIISPMPQCLWPPNVAGYSLLWWTPVCKFTQLVDYLIL